MASPAKKNIKTKTQKALPLKWLLIGGAALIILAAALLLILGGKPAADDSADAPLTGTYYVAIEIKDQGVITAELYADIAPITVANFLT